jgi:glyoxylase-like metal-dependent hydrolase (beta-lactamase superfamily II)
MARLPAAKLVAHPRGARHMVDPAQLFAGASAVYGAEETRRLYGAPIPVPAERVIEAADEQVFMLGGRPLQCLHTPGHAKHHLCIWDKTAHACFTGDAFGLSYRELDVAGRPFIFPATTPVQFDPEAMKASIRRLLALQPEAMYLTHFSRVGGAERGDEVARLGADLLRRVDTLAALAEAAPGESEARKAALRASLLRFLSDEAPEVAPALLAEVLETDLELNAQGLLWWLEHR